MVGEGRVWSHRKERRGWEGKGAGKEEPCPLARHHCHLKSMARVPMRFPPGGRLKKHPSAMSAVLSTELMDPQRSICKVARCNL